MARIKRALILMLSASLTQKNNNFLWLSLGSNQYRAGRVYDLCLYFMTGALEGSPKVFFMEKPGIAFLAHG